MVRVVWAVCVAGLLVAACGGASPVDAPTPVATAEPLAGAGSERSGAAREGQTAAESDLEAPSSVQPGESSNADGNASVSEASEAATADGESAVATLGGEGDSAESGAPEQARPVAGTGEETYPEPTTLDAALAEVRDKPLVAGEAPSWPFRGLVQLWHGTYDLEGERRYGWVVRYWVWESATLEHREVPLPGLEVDCLGRVALVSHGELGLEFGGAPGAVSDGFWIPWGGAAETVGQPSGALLEEVAQRNSNVAVAVAGDVVRVGEGPKARDYLMRDPVRGGGGRWTVQARHDGDLFILTVHPAHLACMSGVSWLSLADTGELVFCGANTAATAFVAPEAPNEALVLPAPDTVGTYLSCPARMDLRYL